MLNLSYSTTPIETMNTIARRSLFPQQRRQRTVVIESDVQVHIQDTPLVSAIRDGKIVELPWNKLTKAEQRAAQVNLFCLGELS